MLRVHIVTPSGESQKFRQHVLLKLQRKDVFVKLDLWVQIPTHLVDRLETLFKNPDLRNRDWIVTPIAGSWMIKENQILSLTKLFKIKESLGIQHIGKMVIDWNTINLCFLARGLKSLPISMYGVCLIHLL